MSVRFGLSMSQRALARHHVVKQQHKHPVFASKQQSVDYMFSAYSTSSAGLYGARTCMISSLNKHGFQRRRTRNISLTRAINPWTRSVYYCSHTPALSPSLLSSRSFLVVNAKRTGRSPQSGTHTSHHGRCPTSTGPSIVSGIVFPPGVCCLKARPPVGPSRVSDLFFRK